MKRILFVNGHMNIGGVEKSLLDILRHIDYNEYAVDLLLLEEYGDFYDEIPSQVNVRFCDLKPTYGPFFKSMVRCLKKHDYMCIKARLMLTSRKLLGHNALKSLANALIGLHEYDTAVGFRPGICSDIVAYSVKAKRKITWWHHGEFNIDSKSYTKMCSRMDRVVSVSDGCKKMLINACPMIEQKLSVIPNMLDVAEIIKKAEVGSLYCNDDRIYIVSVGRLEPEKNFQNIVRVVSELVKKGHDNIEWHIVGEGSQRRFLQKTIDELGVQDKVVLEGNQINPYPYIKNADLYVHPSYVESQGLAILEAMSLGVPCVAAKSIGAEGLIKDGINGILVEKSAEALLRGVLGILSDKQLYDKIKQNTICPEEFLPENVMNALYRLL